MKKSTVVIIALVAILGFAALLWYGLTHARGTPGAAELPERKVLTVPRTEKDIALDPGTARETWDAVPSTRIDLIYQLTVPPWPKRLTPSVEVKALHNQKDIFFRMQWNDDTEDRLLRPGKFSDACAIMFPLGTNVTPASIMMGFLGRSNIWQWKASQDRQYWGRANPAASDVYADYHYPFEDEETLPVSRPEIVSAVNDLVSIRVATLTPKEHQRVQGRGVWSNGQWQVVFKRPLAVTDAEGDAVFPAGTQEMWCAFAVWNGAHEDQGGRKSISGLISLKIE